MFIKRKSVRACLRKCGQMRESIQDIKGGQNQSDQIGLFKKLYLANFLTNVWTTLRENLRNVNYQVKTAVPVFGQILDTFGYFLLHIWSL